RRTPRGSGGLLLPLLGVGLSTFVEVSGGGWEYGGVHVEADGTIVVTTGASPHGQGHETTLTQVVSDALGVPMSQVRVVHSDTAAVPRGVGTFGSRSGQLAGNAVALAAAAVLEQARVAAGSLLEADPADVVVSVDGLSVAGVPARAVSWAEVVAAAPGGRLAAEDDFAQDDGTYPFGAHLAVVEVDAETGAVTLRRLVAVDDCGTVVNPTIVEGQIHGGLAQGIAQALFEDVRYDDVGNPLTATLADYGMPSAAELPSFELGETVTPSPRNPLGMKGIGESGTVGATVAVQNAVVDALAPLGIRHIDMPLGPGRVWEAIREAAAD
ncbi:MAG: xanthine dehydrogenase family protein molybdopterin-binding subunit, partial [Acidimicrobiales bacterium]